MFFNLYWKYVIQIMYYTTHTSIWNDINKISNFIVKELNRNVIEFN